MSRHVPSVVLGASLSALALGIWLVPALYAGEENKYKSTVLKIAAEIKKGNKDAAATQAAALAKKIEDLEEIMELFKKRDEGGLGVGSKPKTVLPDGIEIKLVTMGMAAPGPGAVKKEAEALEEMAYHIAAIAEITKAKGPPKGKGKDWGEWSEAMRVGAQKLAEAAKAKSGPDLKTAASKLNDSCNACHSKYRAKP